MKKSHGSNHKYILIVILLAIICIGGVELAVCAVKEPQLYQRLTAPVRAAAESAGQAGRRAWTGVTAAAEEAWDSVTAGVDAAWDAAGNAADRLTAALFRSEADSEEPVPLEEDQLVPEESQLSPIPETARRLTSLVERDGMEYLTGGSREIVYYNQRDEQWAQQPYGTDQIGGYGCGPTAMAMAVSTLTGQLVDPAAMAQWCVTQGHWARKQGSYLSVVSGVAKDYDLKCESVDVETLEESALCQRLAAGELAVALMGKGHFSNSGHFILLRGVTLDGKILVADPASRDRTLVTWEPELILDELSRSRSNGAPLWLLSVKTELAK